MQSIFQSIETSKMLILMALPLESQGLIEKWAEQHKVPLVFTGMGLIHAAAKATEAIHKFQPQFVLNLGTAGSHQMKPGTVVECTEFLRRDLTLSLLNKKITTTARTSLQATSCGSADNVDTTEAVKGFGVVDMEAYALATVCKIHQVEFCALKVVSDVSKFNVKAEWEKNLQICSEKLYQALTTALISRP